MIKLFTTGQIAGIDQYTIEHEPILDTDLMERAAREMRLELYPDIPCGHPVVFFAGPGNNGGDALAMARLFAEHDHPCSVYLLDTGKPLAGSPAVNLERLAKQEIAVLKWLRQEGDFPPLESGALVIDGLFGSGLKRPLSGLAAALVRHINRAGCRVFSIDIPSGLMGEDNRGNDPEHVVRASVTLTLQFPKLSLLFPENEQFSGEVRVVDIGLHPDGIAQTPSPYGLLTAADIRPLIPARPGFAHKGTFGHALLVAGSRGKSGAAVLAAQACLRSGAGLVTVHVPAEAYPVIQTAVPEAMCSVDPHPAVITELPLLSGYSAAGIGPGLGRAPETLEALKRLLREAKVPMVIDADGLNLIAENPRLLELLPAGTILTPHPGEFRRLFGDPGDSWHRLQLQREMASLYGIYIVLKGAYTTVAFPGGDLFFNPTGNPGMATGGSGDVLTGLITGFLAQGLAPGDAAMAGIYLHGLAGDLAAEKISRPALIASDIIRFMGKAFQRINDTR
jgi:NAD(P)H-hydrate epimerase